jgi:hypothetical protein
MRDLKGVWRCQLVATGGGEVEEVEVEGTPHGQRTARCSNGISSILITVISILKRWNLLLTTFYFFSRSCHQRELRLVKLEMKTIVRATYNAMRPLLDLDVITAECGWCASGHLERICQPLAVPHRVPCSVWVSPMTIASTRCVMIGELPVREQSNLFPFRYTFPKTRGVC